MSHSDRMGWRSNIGGCSSASSMAVMPTAQISHRWLYPPFFSTAATSGAILTKQRHVSIRHIIARSLSFFQNNVKHKGVNGKGAYGNVLDHALFLYCKKPVNIIKSQKLPFQGLWLVRFYVFKNCFIITRLDLFICCSVVFINTVKQ